MPHALYVSPWLSTEALRVIGTGSHGGDNLPTRLARLKCQYSFEAAGSSLKFCRIAQGQADIYSRFGPTSQWDTEAGQCVVVAAAMALWVRVDNNDMAVQGARYSLWVSATRSCCKTS